MTLDEAIGSPTGVWPDNVAAVDVFIAMSTQWRVGMSGATGLDYGVLPVVMRHAGIKRSAQAAVFADLRILESAALEIMREAQ